MIKKKINESSTINIKILDKDFQVSCPEDKQDDLLIAANQLDKRMRNIQIKGSIVGLERIAVMAALNLNHELISLKNKDQAHNNPETEKIVNKINRKLDKVLTK
jgi:cell division protein ZapA